MDDNRATEIAATVSGGGLVVGQLDRAELTTPKA